MYCNIGRRRGAGLGVRGALGWACVGPRLGAWQAWRTAGRARGRRDAREAGRRYGCWDDGRHGRRRAGARQQAGQADARACRGVLAALRHSSLALRHGQAAHDTATSARPVRAGWASLANWVPMHLTQFFFDLVFDSILFLSHRLDTDHEHCS